MKYNLSEITPKSMACGIGACPAIYVGRKDITPESMTCGPMAGCPAVYAGTKELTQNECILGACPAVFESKNQEKDVYLIIGKKINPSEVGLGDLERKIGEGEVLIEVPAKLINEMRK